MVLDGAATIGVVIDESQCSDVKDCNHFIKIGSEARTSPTTCKRTRRASCASTS